MADLDFEALLAAPSNKDCVKNRKLYLKSAHKTFMLRNPDYNRDYNLRRKYGITLVEYNILCKKQSYLCYICRLERKLHVDHNHETNINRKLLCNKCNTQLHYYEYNIPFSTKKGREKKLIVPKEVFQAYLDEHSDEKL